jgi:hypothetical protein
MRERARGLGWWTRARHGYPLLVNNNYLILKLPTKFSSVNIKNISYPNILKMFIK